MVTMAAMATMATIAAIVTIVTTAAIATTAAAAITATVSYYGSKRVLDTEPAILEVSSCETAKKISPFAF